MVNITLIDQYSWLLVVFNSLIVLTNMYATNVSAQYELNIKSWQFLPCFFIYVLQNLKFYREFKTQKSLQPKKELELEIYSALGTFKNGNLTYFGKNQQSERKSSEIAGGIFKSDFTHGIEVFYAMIICEEGKEKLILRKITGDPNVPAGKVSVKCSSVPAIG